MSNSPLFDRTQFHSLLRLQKMANSVPRPDLNQGISAGIMGRRFGNDRGSDFSSPMYMAKSQPTTVEYTNFRHHYQLPTFPTDNNWDASWRTGTLIFVQRNTNILVNVMSLEMVRYYLHQATIAAYNDRQTKNDVGEEVLKARARGRGMNYTFLADFDTIMDKLAFAGIVVGETSPLTAGDGMTTMGSSTYTGDYKNTPFSTWGKSVMPNFFGDVPGGTPLYMLLKPMPALERYVSPSGDAQMVPENMRKERALIPDFHFMSSIPKEMTDLKVLFEGKGEQPPIDCLEWIDWELDKTTGEYIGEVKRGIYWQIGVMSHTTRAQNTGAFVPSTKKAERLPWKQNYLDLPQVEVLIHNKRNHGYK